MNESSPSEPATTSLDVLARMEVRGEDGVYLLGCFERPATLYMQQCRAINLLWALHSNDKLAKKDVVVVGSGVGGITAAATALLLGCKVTLLEQHGNLLPFQRGNHTRALHPKIYYWPQPGSEDLTTNLPLMNWKANLAGEVSNQLLKQWNDNFSALPDVTVRTGCEVVELTHDNGKCLLRCHVDAGNDLVRCDVVILAVGFGVERQYDPLPSFSYWHDDNLHQPVLRKPLPRRYLVTGCGDGGLIDALRLRIDGFEHGEIAELAGKFKNSDDIEGIKKALLEIESHARSLGKDRDVSAFLFEQYKLLNVSTQLKTHEPSLRADTLVHLHNRDTTTPLSLRASILNRFMVFLLVHYRGMRYYRGEVDWDKVTWEKGRGYRVEFRAGSRTDIEYYHDIIFRHGPQNPVTMHFPLIAGTFKEKSLTPEDPTRFRLWSEEFDTELRASLAVRTDQAATRRAKRDTDASPAFLGRSIEQGEKALKRFQVDANQTASTVVKLLGEVSIDWKRTHSIQVMHRFKQFFASCQDTAAPLLIKEIKEGGWPRGLFAAECFDYFTDPKSRIDASNELAEALPKWGSSLLDRPDPARFTIAALGYLGATDWRHVILRVLEETKSDFDQKFRDYSLTAAAFLFVKARPDDFFYLHNFLSTLLYGFEEGKFCPSPRPIEERELYWSLRRWLGRRKNADGADHFIDALTATNGQDARGLVRGCYAHILGAFQLPQAIEAIRTVLMRTGEPKELRIECARSLGRVRQRDAATALRDAVSQLESEQMANLVRGALVCVAHFAEEPAETLEEVLQHWNPEYINPVVLRAIGLCRAERFIDRLKAGLRDSQGEIRGHAGLALAQLNQPLEFEDRVKHATSDLERILFALAHLVSGGRPDPKVIETSLQNELFEWSGQVVEDVQSILSGAEDEYRKLLTPWEPILAKEAENLKYLYG